MQPGCSWRVGVVAPPDPSIDMAALGEIGQAMLGSKKVKPAVMAVAVHVGNRRSSAMLLSHMGAGAGWCHTELLPCACMHAESSSLAKVQPTCAASKPVQHRYCRNCLAGGSLIKGSDAGSRRSSLEMPRGRRSAEGPVVTGRHSAGALWKWWDARLRVPRRATRLP